MSTFLIDSPLFTQNTTFWTIWWLALKFQHFDWFPILFSISISWSIPYFSIKFQHFDRFQLGNKMSTFDQSPLFRSNFNILIVAALLYSNFNILTDFDIFHSNFNILINSHLIALKPQLFDWFPTFHSNINILIELTISTQISTFWLIPNFVLKFQYSDWFISFQIPTV